MPKRIPTSRLTKVQKDLCERFMSRPDVVKAFKLSQNTPGVVAGSIDRGCVKLTLQLGPKAATAICNLLRTYGSWQETEAVMPELSSTAKSIEMKDPRGAFLATYLKGGQELEALIDSLARSMEESLTETRRGLKEYIEARLFAVGWTAAAQAHG